MSTAPSWVETHAFYSELHQAMCCGNCGIPLDHHTGECGEWAAAAIPNRQTET